MLTVGSLFSGIGGLDLGLERAGMRIVWQCESDPYARAVLRKHWHGVPCYEDICALRSPPAVDVLCGGFPCQDISVAGKQAGIDGARSGLWREYARLVSEIRPRYVAVENVSALLERGMGRVLGDLAACGYGAEWDCIPAAAAGAPHERDRVFVVAYDWQAGGARVFAQKIRRFAAFSWSENVGGPSGLRNRSDIPEPLFRGSRDGIPSWVDRLGCLGNAVVPQVAEYIGRLIVAHAEAT